MNRSLLVALALVASPVFAATGKKAGTPVGGNASASTVLATGSTTARALKDRAADTVNVKDFDAKCDGVTDDTAAIQAALAANAGRTIVFPKGTCIVSGTLNPKSYTTLRGEGWKQSKIKYTGSAECLRIVNESSAANGLGVSVYELALEGSGAGQGILLGGTTPSTYSIDGTFRNVDISNFQDGIVQRNSFHCEFYEVQTHGNARYGLYHTPVEMTTATSYNNVHFYGNGSAGFFSDGGAFGLLFNSCTVESNASGTGTQAVMNKTRSVWVDPHVEFGGIGIDAGGAFRLEIHGGNFVNLATPISSATNVQSVIIQGARSAGTSGTYAVDIAGARAKNVGISITGGRFDKPVRVDSDTYVSIGSTTNLTIGTANDAYYWDGIENDGPLYATRGRFLTVKAPVISSPDGPWGVGPMRNLVPDSAGIGTWTTSGTLTANAETDPLGTTTAARFVADGVSARSLYRSFSVAPNTTYYGAFFVRLVSGSTSAADQVRISMYDNSATPYTAVRYFGTSLGAGWQRFDGMVTTGASASNVTLQLTSSAAVTLAVWGPTLQAGSLGVFTATSGSADSSGTVTARVQRIDLGTVQVLTGAGVPSAAAPNGSLFLRTDGAAGSTYYVREGGAWAAK